MFVKKSATYIRLNRICIILCYQHNDDVGVCVVPQLPQPALDVLVGEVLRDVVHQQRTHCASVVPARKRVAFNIAELGETEKGVTYAEVMAL